MFLNSGTLNNIELALGVHWVVHVTQDKLQKVFVFFCFFFNFVSGHSNVCFSSTGRKLSIYHGCMVWIKKSVTRVTDRHHEGLPRDAEQ